MKLLIDKIFLRHKYPLKEFILSLIKYLKKIVLNALKVQDLIN